MELIVNDIGIRNFKSFDNEGVYLNDLKKVNFLVGKNNSGKSNVLKFLTLLQGTGGRLNGFPNFPENYHQNNQIMASFFRKIKFTQIDFPETIPIFKNGNRIADVPMSMILEDYLEETCQMASSQYLIKGEFKQKLPHSDILDETYFLAVMKNTLNQSYNGHGEWEAISKRYEGEFRNWLIDFISKVIYIPDIRVISENHNVERSNSVVNGTNIISKIYEMRNFDVGEEENGQKLKMIEDKIAELLDVDEVLLEVSKSKKLIVIINGNRRYIETLGAGVHELVFLTCIILLNQKSLVCLEEPESHLHPILQRRFLTFLFETEHQYLITTHSNNFIDFISNDISVYHVENIGNVSKINKSLTSNGLRLIINDLGYKASDLIQSNGIIWVEGPSDRNFINKWITLINPNLIEGIHYSIMFYGGKLLSHLKFEDIGNDDRFIEMLRINQNYYVVIDKDRINSVGRLNDTKERIKGEVGDGKYWITFGKEIENYLNVDLINKWISTKDGMHISTIGSNDDTIPGIIKSQNESIEYSKAKAIYSREIAELISIVDLEYLDLNEQVLKLIENIIRWNDM